MLLAVISASCISTNFGVSLQRVCHPLFEVSTHVVNVPKTPQTIYYHSMKRLSVNTKLTLTQTSEHKKYIKTTALGVTKQHNIRQLFITLKNVGQLS